MTPQLTIPQSGDPYYNRISTGGYNPCIYGNPQRRVTGLNVLPNCVGYSVGRFNSLGNYGYCKYLGNTNAANFVDLAKKQGLLITETPTLGGVMVWNGGKGNLGHVACVELLMGSRIITSESEYYGKPFTIYTRSGKDWRDGCYWMGSSYHYIGCIKNPAVENDMDEKEIRKLIREEFHGLFLEEMEAYLEERQNLPANAYAEPALKWAKENGIIVGNEKGNQMPKSWTERQDLAVILYALMRAQEKNHG